MSALDEVLKRREELEMQKRGFSQPQIMKQQISQRKEEKAQTGKLYFPNLSPVKGGKSTIDVKKLKETTKKKEETPWYKQIFTKGEFKDGVDGFGDALYKGAKSILGTTTDLTQDMSKGVLNVVEAPVDIATNLVASGANALGFKDTAKSVRKFADKDLAENISRSVANSSVSGIAYNILNGTAENIVNPTGFEYDKNKSLLENYGGYVKHNVGGDYSDETKAYEKSSFGGKYVDKTAELVGYSLGLIYGTKGLDKVVSGGSVGSSTLGASASGGNIGLTVAGKTLNIPTLALMGGASSGLQEANSKEDVTEFERWSKALSSGLIEGATEGMFGMFGVGGVTDDAGKEIFDVIGEKAAGLFKSSVAKTLANIGVKATGESMEELASYTANFFVDNGIIDKIGDADFSKEWDWAEVGEQMALAFVSAGITQGAGQVIQNNEAIKAAEEQLGRKLTSQEKAMVTQAAIEGTMEEKVARMEQQNTSTVAQTDTEDTQVPQTTKTVEQLDNEIQVLESQLNENLSDEQYNAITEQIRIKENQIEQIENGAVQSSSEAFNTDQLQQTVQPTTQEVETNSLVDASSNTLETGNMQRLVNKTFAEQVDEAIQGKYPKRDMLVVSENTPKILQDIGLSDLPITMTQKHLYTMTNENGKYKNVNYHNIDPEIIKQIPEALARPLDVLKSDTKEDSIVVVTELADKNDDIIVASIKIDGKGQINDIQIDSNVMTSAYGKSGNYDYFMKDNIEKGNLLYDIDEGIVNTIKKDTKKESDTTDRFQLPMRGSSSKTTSDIPKNISPITTNNITSNEKNVNSPINNETSSKVQEDLSPIKEVANDLKQLREEVKEQVEDLKEAMDEFQVLTKEQKQDYEKLLDEANKQEQTPPPEIEVHNDKLDTASLEDKTISKITKDFASGMKLNKSQKAELNSAIKELSSRGNLISDDVLDVLYNYDEMSIRERNEDIAEAKGRLRSIPSLKISPSIANDVDMTKLRPLAKNNLKFKIEDMSNVDVYYDELSSEYPHLFPSDIITPSQQFEKMVEVASTPIYSYETMKVPHGTLEAEAEYIYNLMEDYKIDQKTKDADKETKEWLKSRKKINIPETQDVEEISPVKEEISKEAFNKKVEELSGEIKNELGYIPKDPTRAESYEYDEEIAKIVESVPKNRKEEKIKTTTLMGINLIDKAMPFENLALKTGNRELDAKYDFIRTANSRANYIMRNGHEANGVKTSKSLDEIRAEVDNTGLTKEFNDYIYHKHNVDRMNLSTRFEDMVDKPVFGYSVTSEISQQIVNQYEMAHPEFMDFAQDVYDYVKADRTQLVEKGVISQETADLWQQMYPHYVPIKRVDTNGNAINVALDTNRTGINAPIKKATGGNSDFLPLFETMAQRTIQTEMAAAKNSFGIELKNTLKSNSITNETNIDEIDGSIDNQESLLQEGKNGASPTFTVFENGKKVTYEITEDMYLALKPLGEDSIWSKTSKTLNTISSVHRGLLTQYNLLFAMRQAMMDPQDIIMFSQHPAKTYAKIPESIMQQAKKGHYYNEYMRNGGDQNSYFDTYENTFDTERKGIYKLLDLPPLKQIAQINDFIEMTPRLAEYIASRESGKSIEGSMLDAARVTTNFKAGGDITKALNRNGVTFLNASVQGAMQNVRMFREAKANGARGYAQLVTRFAMASVPVMILNALLWGDDDEYEELSDYVKQNYYIVGKYGDGQFIRIPKGRAVAVVQDALEQAGNAITGDEEADYGKFLDLVWTNIAPNNPIQNNVLSPMFQVLKNETWYGDDLIPQRLQDLPAAEQFDETTDSFSRWLGEKTNISPIKINYLLNQYSGGLGDVVMPMITPKATQGEGSPLLAPIKDKFTVDGVMKNQNVSDFYETSEKLTSGAKSKNATDEDILKNKYINSVKNELNDLYKEKREIQSDLSLSKGEKYNKAKEIQKQINEITKKALKEYSDGNYTDNYGIIDDKEFYKNLKGEWEAVDKKEKEALNNFGLSLEEKSTYFDTLQSLNDISDQYKGSNSDYSLDKKREVISTIQNTGLSEEVQARLYKKEYNTDDVDRMLITGIGINNYFDYVLQDIKADKNSKGNAISGSRKNKVIRYVNEYELNIAQKAILIKSTNTFKFNEYNNDIVEYVVGLDVGYEDKVKILEDLKMKVHDDGSVTWED